MLAFLIYFTDADIATTTVMQTTTMAADSTSAETVTTIATTGYHKLNRAVLTATSRSYGKGQNSTPYKIKTPERIGRKFSTVDYVLEICPQNKFGDDRSSGGFWVNM